LKLGDDQELQFKGKLEVSEYDNEYMSNFEAMHWVKPPIADLESNEYGMNAPDSFKKRAESQIEKMPIEVSEIVNIDDIKLSPAEADPLGNHLNILESPIAYIFSRD
jgi:hypothetical protein